MSSQKEPADTDADIAPVEHVAHLTGKTPRTVRRWCRSGKVEAEKDEDNTWQIRLDSIPDHHTTPSGEKEGKTADALAGHLVDLARQNALLEERLSRALPSGDVDAETARRCVKIVRRLAGYPIVSRFIPEDIREKLRK